MAYAPANLDPPGAGVRRQPAARFDETCAANGFRALQPAGQIEVGEDHEMSS